MSYVDWNNFNKAPQNGGAMTTAIRESGDTDQKSFSIAELNRLFTIFDKFLGNRDGFLTQSELKQALSQDIFKQTPKLKELAELLLSDSAFGFFNRLSGGRGISQKDLQRVAQQYGNPYTLTKADIEQAIQKEGGPTTEALNEEGGGPTTLSLQETGNPPPYDVATTAVAHLEGGGHLPPPPPPPPPPGGGSQCGAHCGSKR